MAAKKPVSFDLECVDLPDAKLREYDALRLGLQVKKEVKQDVACSVRQARFMFTLEVDLDNGPRFFGPYVQGTPGEQFVYLVWGQRDGEAWVTSRRVKVPLSSIDPQRITAAIAANLPLSMRIIMTNSRGEPIAATLKAGQFEWV